MGKGFRAMDFDLLPDIPIAIEMVAVEEADRTEPLVDRAAAKFFDLLKMNEVIENLRFTNPGGAGVRVESVELSNRKSVILFCLLTEVFEMDKTDEILVPLLRSDCVL